MSFPAELFGFVDGSFKMNENGSFTAGMGGFIKDRDNKILFIFSGHVHAITSFLAELYALKHMLQAIRVSKLANKDASFILIVKKW